MTETRSAPVEGLRERKKRQTRLHISDVATGLFLERGFDAVTVAEIAEAADVSVNTVYNYFSAKEDLFFDRSEEFARRLPRIVKERAPGESAAAAALRGMRTDLAELSPSLGLVEGYVRFLRVMRESPALLVRLHMMEHEYQCELARTLREEAGEGPDDPLPDLVAGQLAWLEGVVFEAVAEATLEGASPELAAALAAARLDAAVPLLGEKVLAYAVKPVT
ncbi:MAG: TetR/AcrR family transcriptional regulator [Streptomycetaceae bacterium]|nr:TetR/AcrR family transcriptional regulator [Streptomycetaceae bacterium]